MFPVIEQFHHYWYLHRDYNGSGLCSWTEGAESGMDDGVRFVGAKKVTSSKTCPTCFDFWSIDLNSYLYREKLVLADMADAMGNHTGAAFWRQQASALLVRLQQIDAFWNSTNHFFQDQYFNGTSVPVLGCEGFTALFAQVATQEQANSMAAVLNDSTRFLLKLPLPTVSRDNPHFSHSGYWKGPNWFDQTWFAYTGLKHYGHHSLAADIQRRVFVNGAGLKRNDTTPIGERYNPDDGEIIGATHFSWSAAHLLMWAAGFP